MTTDAAAILPGRLIRIATAFLIASSTALGQDPDPPARPADPIRSEAEYQRGAADFGRGAFDEALRRFDAAGPAGAGVSYFRGLSLLGLGRPGEAISAFEIARSRPRHPAQLDLDLGIAQLSGGETDKASTTLDAYALAHPDDPFGLYFSGVALFRQRKYDDALTRFRAAAVDPRLAPYLDFYGGLAAIARDEAGSGAFFDRYLKASPAGASADAAGRLAFVPATRGTLPGQGRGSTAMPGGGDRRYNLAVLNGYEFDTNVALAPGITPLGLGTNGRKVDSRYYLATFGDYRLVQREDVVLGLIGSTYDSFQFRLNQYNVQDYMLGGYLNAAIRTNLIAGLRYEFHETLLAGRQFLTDQRLTPNLTLREGSFGHTTVFYEFEPETVKGFALVPAQIRTGDVNAVGATQAFYLAQGAGRLFLSYRYENARTVGSDFDRSTDQVDARLEIPIPGKSVLSAEARYFWDDYKHPNSLDFRGRARRDERIEARIGVQTFFTPHLSSRVDYLYTDNQSNVRNLFGAGFYSYDRSVLSAMLIYDF